MLTDVIFEPDPAPRAENPSILDAVVALIAANNLRTSALVLARGAIGDRISELPLHMLVAVGEAEIIHVPILI
jgi:hypothetical protein